MRRPFIYLALVLLFGLLSGCGQFGKLYLPPEQKQKTASLGQQ